MAIKRHYGQERTLGDIMFNPTTKTVFCSLKLGFFGSKTITLMKRADGCYDLLTTKYNSDETIKIGQTYPVKKQDGTVIEGLTQTTLGLLTTYNEEKKKELTDTTDALFITTHKLKEPKTVGNKGFKKIGYITGKFGIEIAENSQQPNNQHQAPQQPPANEADDEEIPF